MPRAPNGASVRSPWPCPSLEQALSRGGVAAEVVDAGMIADSRAVWRIESAYQMVPTGLVLYLGNNEAWAWRGRWPTCRCRRWRSRGALRHLRLYRCGGFDPAPGGGAAGPPAAGAGARAGLRVSREGTGTPGLGVDTAARRATRSSRAWCRAVGQCGRPLVDGVGPPMTWTPPCAVRRAQTGMWTWPGCRSPRVCVPTPPHLPAVHRCP